MRSGSEVDVHQMMRELAVVEQFRAAHVKPLARVAANLRYYVAEASEGAGDVGQRLKRMSTILDKLGRHPTMQLSRMNDVAGCRGVLPNQAAVDYVIERLQGQRRWQLVPRTWDYVAEPKPDGYRAKHLVAIKEGLRIEIQLRTIGQHQWANFVERIDRERGTRAKFGEADTTLTARLASAAETMSAYERGEASVVELITELASVEVEARRKR